jgi:hypothetical protein
LITYKSISVQPTIRWILVTASNCACRTGRCRAAKDCDRLESRCASQGGPFAKHCADGGKHGMCQAGGLTGLRQQRGFNRFGHGAMVFQSFRVVNHG